jgi:hypothetical protein
MSPVCLRRSITIFLATGALWCNTLVGVNSWISLWAYK